MVCAHLAVPLLLGAAADQLVRVSHHRDEHVEQENGHEDGEEAKHDLSEDRHARLVKVIVLPTQTRR